MPSFDGIQRGHVPIQRPIPRSAPEPPQTRRLGVGRATPRNAGFVIGLVVLAAVFALLRPNGEASEIPTVATTTVSEARSSTNLPSQLADPPSEIRDDTLDQFVVLDQPTDSSKPQPESSSEISGISGQASPTDNNSSAGTAEMAKNFTIRILNGGGKAGAAADLRTELTKQAFTISSVGNAQQTYDATIIYYQPGKRVEAELVAKKLGEPAVTLEENAIAKPADLLIVIGSDRSQ